MSDKSIEARVADLDEMQGKLLEALEAAEASEGMRMQEDLLRDAMVQ